uniref:t-SNARE coiled-coil homology domain-containing protein n=1 Tax=Panagrellus redivivus TaxID=6233 RepID=A0A7E4VT78_PANRE
MSNPFDDHSSLNVRSYTSNNTVDDEINNYEKELERILQESLDSTQRSAQRLENSEQLATNTAQELLAQREKLERTEKNLDDIHRTTHETQRNLNSLKSIFGGFFKNKFSRAPPKETTTKVSSSASESKLSSHLNGDAGRSSSIASPSSGPSLSAESRSAMKGTRFEAMDNQIDENLDMMSAQLGNLRTLGRALGTEVEDQNQMLDRIQAKADRNDSTVRSQDTQMKKLLGFKGVEKSEDTAAFSKKK